MNARRRWLLQCAAGLLCASVLPVKVLAQNATQPTEKPDLYFNVEAPEQLVALGAPVVLKLSLYNASGKSFLVRRLTDDQVVIRVTGPDGKEVPWHGNRAAGSIAHSFADYEVLETYREVSREKTISVEGGVGLEFTQPGQYWVTAQYSSEAYDDLKLIAGGAEVLSATFQSQSAAFCVEACAHGTTSVPNDDRMSQTATETVRVFYDAIVRYHPLGLPSGAARKAIRPLLSNRLVQELESLEACDEDYNRLYNQRPKVDQGKPETPWLEEGLFLGPDEAAEASKFKILGSHAIADKRFEVHLKFTFEQTDDCDEKRPCETWDFEGIATVAEENGRFVIDDFISLYGNDRLSRLSEGYKQCKGGKWLGTAAERNQ